MYFCNVKIKGMTTQLLFTYKTQKMELTDYKERIYKKNEIQLASTLIVLIESIESTKRAINNVMKDDKNKLVEVENYFDGKLTALNDILHTIDILL